MVNGPRHTDGFAVLVIGHILPLSALYPLCPTYILRVNRGCWEKWPGCESQVFWHPAEEKRLEIIFEMPNRPTPIGTQFPPRNPKLPRKLNRSTDFANRIVIAVGLPWYWLDRLRIRLSFLAHCNPQKQATMVVWLAGYPLAHRHTLLKPEAVYLCHATLYAAV